MSKTIKYEITFHTYWHCGSGLAAGADVDALVIKDKNGLPYVPGKTIKGLVREAVDILGCDCDKQEYNTVFGQPDEEDGINGNEEMSDGGRSKSFFANAMLGEAERDYILANKAAVYFYRSLASTAVDDNGIAEDNKLRKIQVTVPCTLYGEIYDVDESMSSSIENALSYVKRMGVWRNRGLGRCTIKVIEPATDNRETKRKEMKQLKFKCELLSDVILNQKAATEGPNRTLDFIPGSNFLGIVAGKLYKELNSGIARRMFHSDEVRFGDAHPAHGENRTLRIPAALFYPKLDKEDERVHRVHHKIANPDSDELRKAQLKKERTGFVDFLSVTPKGGKAVRKKVTTNFSIKSAYDRTLRRSKDKQMFGYQSMDKGLTLYFQVEIENSMREYNEKLIDALCGIRRIGRSRSAQYGLVGISLFDYKEVRTMPGKSKEVVIYADSRLIFLDDAGMPVLQPTIKQLLGEERNGRICWEKSQIGTFKYAPYNHSRNCFDADRYGLEKGSVIVLLLNEPVDVATLCNHIGSYQNEGFGKVIFNPAFLEADMEGKTKYKIIAEPSDEINVVVDKVNPETELTKYISKCIQAEKENTPIYKMVNKWVEGAFRNFKGETFASQWGTIRSIAMKSNNCDELKNKLFEKDKGYLVHGVAKEKWAGYLKALNDFIEENRNNAPMAVVNLASQMQHKIRKGV